MCGGCLITSEVIALGVGLKELVTGRSADNDTGVHHCRSGAILKQENTRSSVQKKRCSRMSLVQAITIWSCVMLRQRVMSAEWSTPFQMRIIHSQRKADSSARKQDSAWRMRRAISSSIRVCNVRVIRHCSWQKSLDFQRRQCWRTRAWSNFRPV